MAGKGNTNKSAETPDVESTATDATETGAGTAAAAPQEHVVVRLREDYELFKGGIRYSMKKGERLSSRDYNLDKMHERGAQMDVLDADKRTVLCDYADIAG